MIARRTDGSSQALDAEPGESVMAILRQHDLPIAAICSGCMSCATCHVLVDLAWAERLLPPEAGEMELLASDPSYEPGRSRLSCQIPFVAELDGLTVTVVES